MNGKHKLYDYEVTPPASAWDRLAASLDEDAALHPLAGRLYDTEAAPPPSAWDRISKQLADEAGETVVVRMETTTPDVAVLDSRNFRIPVLMRYAAAAVVIGLVAFAIYRGSDNRDQIAPVAVNTPPVAPVVTPTKPSNNLPLPLARSTDSLETGNAVASGSSIASTGNSAAAASHLYSASRNSTAGRRNYNTSEEDPQNAIYAYEDHMPESADRYVLLLTPEGTFIRMAKKLSSLICCVSGQEQDAECKDQIRKWQQEIATSPVSPAPGNVMEILDLVNSLNNGTQL